MKGIVDTHLHFWDPTVRHHDWLRNYPELNRRFGPEDFDAGGHEIAGAVFVQADARDDEALDEVRWVTRMASEHPWICGIVAFAPVDAGPAAARALEALGGEPLVVGVRQLLQGWPAEAITAAALVQGVRLLSVLGLSFDVCVTSGQLPAVAELARRCPETTFVLDHVGKPQLTDGGLDAWRHDLARLAACPNVLCKLSGLATEISSGRLAVAAPPLLEHAIEVFTPSRCMIGSDWPVVTLSSSAVVWFDLVLDVIGRLAPGEQRAIVHDNAVAAYGLRLPALIGCDARDPVHR